MSYNSPTGKLYPYKGRKIGLMELSRNTKCMVSYQTLKTHLKEGMPIEKAFKRKPPHNGLNKNQHKFPYKGKEYTVTELFNLPECVVKDLKQLQWRLFGETFTVTESILIPIGRKRSEYDLAGDDLPAKYTRIGYVGNNYEMQNVMKLM